MSYCRECYSTHGHVPGCPEDDDNYDDNGDVIRDDDEGDYEEDVVDLDYDVEWVPGKGLTITRFK